MTKCCLLLSFARTLSRANPIRTTALAVGAALTFLPGFVAAHTVAEPNEGTAGASLRAAFRITHGCKGSPTLAVTIRMPEGVLSAKPMPKPGWQLEIKKRPLDKPVPGAHGNMIREAVTEVSWTGGRLENAEFDEFTLLLGLPDRAGETLYFPTVQTCEKGTNNWAGIPAAGQGWHDLPEPAPFIKLNPAPRQQADYTLGQLEIGHPWTRATAPTAPSGGGFLTVANNGTTADRLVAARSSAAQQVQIHEMKMDGNVMRMRELEKGLEIPAGGKVTLAPGGLHLMLMGLKAPLVKDTRVPVTLVFEKAGSIDVELVVSAMGGPAPAHKH